MFDFDKFKLTLSDSMVLGTSTASAVLDYYLKDAEIEKKKQMNDFNKKILLESTVAKENNIAYNTYLENSALEAEAQKIETNISKSASEQIAVGAATGMEGAALSALVRQSQADVLRARGEVDFQQEQNIQAAQIELDNVNADYNQQRQLLELQEPEKPSIFASVIKTGTQVMSAMDKAEKERQQQEYYKMIGTPKAKGQFNTASFKGTNTL